METTNKNIPEGYMQNALGNLVPVDKVKEQDKVRNELVLGLMQEAKELNQRIAEFKTKALLSIESLVALAANHYGVNLGGKKGNISLLSYDGRYRVNRSIADQLSFSEELEAAKQLITECIDEWTQDSNSNVRALVDRAFKANAQGQLKTTAVLELLRLDIVEDKWLRAMDALKNSIQVTSTSTYVRFYQRVGESDQYEAVPLDIASIQTV